VDLDAAQLSELNAALNEATLLNVRWNPGGGSFDVFLRVLTLPEEGPEPQDPRFVLRLTRVGRIVASLRMGNWDDERADVVPLALGDLTETVLSFRSQPIYGWELVDSENDDLATLVGRVSLDEAFPEGGRQHWIRLFQEGQAVRHLDLFIWFDNLEIYDMELAQIPIEYFAAGGRRWWNAFYAGDPRTEGHNMAPLRPD